METSNLLKLFEFELKGNRFRDNSIHNYVNCVSVFLNKFKDRASPKHINEMDIKEFLYAFSEHNTQRAYHSAIKAFYKYVVKQKNKFRFIKYCKKKQKLPVVLSVEEMQRLIFACSNIKHKTILCLMYSTGLRISEVINLKIQNIDSSRMIINIIDAKGGKDRQVTLDPLLLDLLRLYYKEYRPVTYLFNGKDLLQYSESSIAQFLQKYANIAGLRKKVNPHLIRHCYATHLHEAGTDLTIVQRLLGHASIKTTQIYSHTSHNHISKLKTPLQSIVSDVKRLVA